MKTYIMSCLYSAALCGLMQRVACFSRHVRYETGAYLRWYGCPADSSNGQLMFLFLLHTAPTSSVAAAHGLGRGPFRVWRPSRVSPRLCARVRVPPQSTSPACPCCVSWRPLWPAASPYPRRLPHVDDRSRRADRAGYPQLCLFFWKHFN